ncbi:unnamed protein product [Oppiella nova]|uniref:J domain-containing protein n=1 Tax=Oppiella nova TaxID=334625 RepID=A0A7R9QKY3_9ACAR|nr:unnamed protein product [Oppiella nova]CAG2168040.1 unnamed protein product [Oppiella nova]
MSDLLKLDLYELLAVNYDSTQQEIKSSYRRLALGCHPDKCPDNPKAAELFHQLSKALEVLTDETAKSAYDRLLKARKANVIRHKKLDQKRQKLKDELERREKSAKEDVMSEAEAVDQLSREIERLRKEGSKQLETENEILKQQIEEELRERIESELIGTQVLPKLKIIRKSKGFQMSSENIRHHLSRFGDINGLVVTKNQKKALVEFSDYNETLNAYENRHEFEHLFTTEWIGDKPDVSSKSPQMETMNTNQFKDINIKQNESFSSDYESLVLRNMRAAEERKQLIRQMQEQDLQEEGSKQLETENEILKQQIEEELKERIESELIGTQVLPKLKIIRKSKAFQMSSENIRHHLSRFGDINGLVVTKNQKKALVEFSDYNETLNAYENRHEFEHLFTIEWIGDKPDVSSKSPQMETMNTNQFKDIHIKQNESFSSDYESLVLRNMRAAEERKQLIRQMQEQDLQEVD